ncbi:MAG: Holliday junction branch migration DNA helicase RuvB, partial [Planctomycetota bacterium]|nr:Holliday junction branch migration DNA helicase RuvB [Planctomycetota bacterium]
MSRDRVVTSDRRHEDQEPPETSTSADPPSGGPALRPVRMDEYVGQAELVERLSIALEAVRQR